MSTETHPHASTWHSNRTLRFAPADVATAPSTHAYACVLARPFAVPPHMHTPVCSCQATHGNAAAAGEDLASYTCGGPGDEQFVEANAAGVAFAIAESFAEVSTFCTAEGDAEARAQGYALAEARAEAIAEGIASIFATTEVCGDCSTALDLFVSVSKTLVVEAVAEAWTEVRTSPLTRPRSSRRSSQTLTH